MFPTFLTCIILNIHAEHRIGVDNNKSLNSKNLFLLCKVTNLRIQSPFPYFDLDLIPGFLDELYNICRRADTKNTLTGSLQSSRHLAPTIVL